MTENPPLDEKSAARQRNKQTLRRKSRVREITPSRIVAYDLETTRIEVGTPRPLYLSLADGERLDGWPVRSIPHLCELIETHFLTEDQSGAKFVAWNANNFDAYFIAAALINSSDKYIIRPYLTRSKNMRGFRVMLREDFDAGIAGDEWEFLDGIAMLGLAGTTLDNFLKVFAPNYLKLDAPNWETEQFDHKNKKHVEYALRDSEGLYHGMRKAESILIETFNERLGATIGNSCIKIFQANMPQGTFVAPLTTQIRHIVRGFLMRGGYCHAVRRYEGAVWKYDLNQAYAAAMRDCWLPAGDAAFTNKRPKYARAWAALVSIKKRGNIVPVYAASTDTPRPDPQMWQSEAHNIWLTSLEIEQLESENWTIDFHQFIVWGDAFQMREFVDKLERIRTTCEGGPKGAIGTMAKAVGNHSFGKTTEVLDGLELLMCKECPDGFTDYRAEDSIELPHLWQRFGDPELKAYHQPQIGAFITAHARMVLRRAIMLAPRDWLYADTDCVVFSSDQTARLDVDPKRYGAWKLEESGTPYRIIAKKVYYSMDFETRAAKGLNVKRLSREDFDAWYAGNAPQQSQVQRNNFLKVMQGASMFRGQVRSGTRVKIST